MRKTLLTCCLVLSSLTLPLHAAEPDKAAAKATVLELCKLVIPEEAYKALTEQMEAQLLESLKQSGATVPADAAQRMKRAVAEVVPYQELLNWNVDVYASRFSADEIKELIAFYKSPAGKKMARLQPELSGEVGKKMAPLLIERMPKALSKQGLAPTPN